MKKPILFAVCALLTIAVGGGIWFFAFRETSPQQEVPGSRAKSFGEKVYDQVQNPAANIPDTNPFEVQTNPFEEAQTNPFKDAYKNPFEK